MKTIFKKDERETIKGQKEFGFKSFSSLHLVIVTARVRSRKQISSITTDDEDLIVKIDGKGFPSLTDSHRFLDSPAAFSGGVLHNLSKTVYFLVFLKGENHQITLITDQPGGKANLEKLEVYALSESGVLNLEINQQSEDGDRRPWLTFVFDELALESFTPTFIYSRRRFDSDDIKIIFDGKTYTNLFKTIKYFFWRFAGFLLPGLSRTEKETFTVKVSSGLHYLEFWADRQPILEKIRLVLGSLKRPEITSYKNPPSRDYNQLDQLISDAVSFWNDFFVQEKDPPPIPLDSNLVKAMAYRESRLGYYPNQEIIDVMQVWDPQNPARDALLGKTVANEFISSSQIGQLSYSYPDFTKIPKVESRKESFFWGVRWLYYKAQYLSIDSSGALAIPYVRKWYTWPQAVKFYNGNPKISDKYVSEVISVYEKGIDAEGNKLW